MNIAKTIATIILLTAFFNVSASNDPNILLIIADDMGADVMPGYNIGTNLPNTPNIDKLRNSGITFTNVWATPVCSATRASLMTGKHGIKNGVNTVPGILSTEHTSIFKQLKQQTNDEYATCLVGKWHIGKTKDYDHPNEHGVDDFMGVMGAGVSDYYKWNKVENQSPDTCYEYATKYFTDYAIDWINKQDQPWMMWMGHVSPHTPYQFPPTGTYSENHTGTPNMKKYLSMIENLDYEIGRLLDSIPSEALENTLIIFVGDNGTPGNVIQGYDKGKGTLYQGGIHVPLVISGKGITRNNETENAQINICDLYATIAHMSDDSIDEKGGLYNSLSFKHLLSGTEGFTRKYNYMELGKKDGFPNDAYTIREEQYKMIQFIDSIQEFYDLYNDPFETNNLLLGNLTNSQQEILENLEEEVNFIRTDWSCKDGIQNGDETGIDCGGRCDDCITKTNDIVKTFAFDIFPNPFFDQINIKQKGSNSNFDIELFNSIGKQIDSYQIQTNEDLIIDMKNHVSGLYFLKIVDSETNEKMINKIIKI